MTPHALIAPARLAGAPLLRTQSDERLVDLVRAGNDAAFEAIVSRYRRPLLRYCSGFMSEARAEDAVQTALVSAFDSLRASTGEMKLRPWLYRIAHNTALNALRDRSLQHEELSDRVDGVERPDQAFDKSERLRDVLAAVGTLPERQRDAIILRELEGRSYDEIAAELGVSGGSVRQLLNRGRNTLRAGMTAVTPAALAVRVPWGGAPGEAMGARVAEMCGAGAGAAVIAKVCATAIVTGAVVGGVASSPSGGLEQGSAHPDGGRAAIEVQEKSGRSGEPESGTDSIGPAADDGNGGRDRQDDGRADSEDRSGPDRGRDRAESREGPSDEQEDRSGEDGSGDSSGPGSGDLVDDDPVAPETDNSGSGSSGSGTSGTSGTSGSGSSGSGSGTSGTSGTSGSGSGSSGSGSGTSGTSGTSGSGSDSSGSDSSGSGSDSSGSGSDSSGSGSGDLDPVD